MTTQRTVDGSPPTSLNVDEGTADTVSHHVLARSMAANTVPYPRVALWDRGQ